MISDKKKTGFFRKLLARFTRDNKRIIEGLSDNENQKKIRDFENLKKEIEFFKTSGYHRNKWW